MKPCAKFELRQWVPGVAVLFANRGCSDCARLSSVECVERWKREQMERVL